MAQYEQRKIGGSVYTVPVGLRSDWQPGQAYDLGTTAAPATAPATEPATSTRPASSHAGEWYTPYQTQLASVLSQAGFRGGADPFVFYAPTGMTSEQRATLQQGLAQLSGPEYDVALRRMVSPGVYEGLRELREEGLRNAIARKQASMLGGGWSMPEFGFPEFPQFQMPTPTPPPSVGPEPVVGPEVKPVEPPAERLPAGVRRGQAGFEAAATPVVAPSVDDLLAQYESVFGPQEGRAREYAQEYLTSPYFGRVMGGAVPFWMQADPLWRLYLHRLGLLQDAVARRLGTGGSAESAE